MNSASKSFSGNEIIGDYDGNLSVVYSSKVDAPNALAGDITLTYNSNVEHRVFFQGGGECNPSGYPVNAPEWIIGYKGIALQTFNFEVNWYATNNQEINYTRNLTGEQAPLLIPGYSYTNRYWATSGQIPESAPMLDYIQILMADGSKKVLYNKKITPSWIFGERIDTGYYVDGSSVNPGYALVEHTTDPTCRHIWYKPGDGLTYFFSEEKAPFADVNFVGDCPRIMYLRQITSINGDTLDFNYSKPGYYFGNGYTISRKLLNSISFSRNSTVLNSVLDVEYLEGGGRLQGVKLTNGWNNQSYTIGLGSGHSYTNWFQNTRILGNGSHRMYVTSITDNVGRSDVFNYQTISKNYKFSTNSSLPDKFSFTVNLKPINAISYSSGSKTDFTYRVNNEVINLGEGPLTYTPYTFLQTTNRDDRTNLMVQSRNMYNKFNNALQLTTNETYTYSGSGPYIPFNDNYNSDHFCAGMTTGILRINQNVTDLSAENSYITKKFSRYPKRYRINYEFDYSQELKLMEETVTSGNNSKTTKNTWYVGSFGGDLGSFDGTFLLKQKEEYDDVNSNPILKTRIVYNYSTTNLPWSSLGPRYVVGDKTETINDSLANFTRYDNTFIQNDDSFNPETMHIFDKVAEEEQYSLSNGLRDKTKYSKTYEYVGGQGPNKGKLSYENLFSDGSQKQIRYYYSDIPMVPDNFNFLEKINLGALIKKEYVGTGVETQYSYSPSIDTVRTWMYDWGLVINANGDTTVLYPPKWKYYYKTTPTAVKFVKTDGSTKDTNITFSDFDVLKGKPFKTKTVYHKIDGSLDSLVNYTFYKNNTLVEEIDNNGNYYKYDYDDAGRMLKATLPGGFPVNNIPVVDTIFQRVSSPIPITNAYENHNTIELQNPSIYYIQDMFFPPNGITENGTVDTSGGSGPVYNPNSTSSIYFQEGINTSNIYTINNAILHIGTRTNQSVGNYQTPYFNIYAITAKNTDGSAVILPEVVLNVNFIENTILDVDITPFLEAVKVQSKPLLGFMFTVKADTFKATSADTKYFGFDGTFLPVLELSTRVLKIDSSLYKGSVVYKYDDDHNNVTMTKRMNFDPLNPKQIVTKQEFDGFGQPRTTLAKNNSDDLEVKSTATFNFLGLKSSEKDAQNRTAFYKYDGFQRMNKIRFQTDQSTAPSQTITYNICQNDYESAYEYKEITDEEGIVTRQFFDKFGNMVREERDTLITRFYYDNLNRLSRVVTPMGKTTTYAYDSFGNLASKTTPDEGTTKYKYDTKGNLRFSVNQEATANGDPLVFIKYDEFKRPYITGLLTPSSTFDSLDANFDYYIDHNSVPHFENYTTDTSKFVTVNMYDNYIKTGVFTNMTNPFGFTSVQNKNLKGRLVATAFRDKLGLKWNYKVYCYDARGNVYKFWVKYENQIWREIDNEYDHAGNLTKQSVMNDFYYWYDYDYEGHLKEVRTSTSNNKATAKLEAVYSYNTAGQDSLLSYPSITNPVMVNNTYNSRGWLEQVASNNGNTNIFSEQLVFTPNGNVSQQIVNYYNFNPSSFDTLKMSYEYDTVNRLIFATNNKNTIKNESYSYDGDGNILSKSRYGKIMTYHYNSGENTLSNIELNFVPKNYSFNYKGNLISDGLKGLTNFIYDYRNLPLSLTKAGQTIVYSYNDKGERILKKTASVNEYYLRDHTGRELVIYDLTANRIKMANIYGNGLIGRVDVNYSQATGWTFDENGNRVSYTYTVRTDDRNYYLKDHLGSNRMTINSLGVVTNVQDFYAYGEVLRSYNNSTPNEKYKFTGKERDTETDLDYFGARFYDSEIGRWTSIDPMASKFPAWSPYNYCMNNPLRFIDPTGMEGEDTNDDKRKINKSILIAKDGEVKEVKIFFKNTASDNQQSDNEVSSVLANATEIAIIETATSNEVNSVTITATTNGKHSSTSKHYGGEGVDIGAVNGKSVSSIGNQEPVVSLQKAFEGQKSRWENFGPADMTKNGGAVKNEKLRIQHKNHIHWSVDKRSNKR